VKSVREALYAVASSLQALLRSRSKVFLLPSLCAYALVCVCVCVCGHYSAVCFVATR